MRSAPEDGPAALRAFLVQACTVKRPSAAVNMDIDAADAKSIAEAIRRSAVTNVCKFCGGGGGSGQRQRRPRRRRR